MSAVPPNRNVQEQNKQIMLRLLDAFNTGNHAAMSELISPNCVDHSLHLGLDPAVRAAPIHDNLRAQVTMDREAIPDGKFEMLNVIAEGDQVVLHWRLRGTNTGPILGRPATHKPLDITGTEYVRIADGKVVEHDDAGYHALEALRQLGLMTHPILEEPRFHT